MSVVGCLPGTGRPKERFSYDSNACRAPHDELRSTVMG